MKRFGIIYLITRLADNKRYVGQTTYSLERRLYNHKRNNASYIGRALQKYGDGAFRVEELATAFSRECLNELERYFITYYQTINPGGFNLTTGGDCDYEFSPKSKILNSRALGGEHIVAINVKTKEYKVYDTQHQTEHDGFDVRNVHAVLNDKGSRPTHKGWIFKYLSDVNQSGSVDGNTSIHAQRLVIETSTIEKIIEEYKITTSLRRPNKTRDNASEIVELFTNKKFSAFKISKELGINKKSVLRFLKENNLIRTHQEAQQLRWSKRFEG